ncbi:MAG: EscU/YscU/HrcU family type III secretion system export apparatus switch protein [Bacillota bacterium]
MANEDNRNKSHIRKAVALQYQPERSQAPVVSATGKGWLAEQIISLARDNKVPVVEDDNLVGVLSSLTLGEEVPQELYEAVAAIYAFVMEADRRSSGG